MTRERSTVPPAAPAPPPGAPPKPASPIDWWGLDSAERVEVLGVLGEWVPRLVRMYGLRDSEVPPCWYLHDSLVQELLALFQYRQQQQVLPISPPQAMLDFHQNFQHTLSRLRGWVGAAGCNAAEHLPTKLQPWSVTATAENAHWAVRFTEFLELEAVSEVEDTFGANESEGE